MPSKILVVGCGNIGSRHLQAIVKLPEPANITVIEPNLNSQNKAKSRLNEISSNPDHKITWLTRSELKDPFDLVIVATNSTSRKTIIDYLLENGNKRFLIEKMVCQSKQDYEQLIQNFTKNNSKGWVNTNRRCFPFYQELKDRISSSDNLKISVKSGNNGLGSNAIHFIDLFLWFTNSKTISLDGDSLANELFPNKRGEQYVEFAGNIVGTHNNANLSISFLPSEDLPLTIEIDDKNYHVIIDETNEKITKIRNLTDLEHCFKYLHVSDLTYDIVIDILKNDECCLPTIMDLFTAHCELFRIFNTHIKKVRNKEPTLCPIT